DVNQDFYLEQWFMMPNLLQEFKRDSSIKLIGFPEDIVTDKYSIPAKHNAFADNVFSNFVMPVLELILGKFHYGHPDLWDETYARKRGTSKISWVGEDILGGFELVLRGGRVINRYYIKAAKAREGGWTLVSGMFSKFAMSSAQIAWGRYLYWLSTSSVFGLDRMAALIIGGIGFFLRKPLVKQGIFAMLSLILVMGISGYAGFPSEIIFAVLALVFTLSIVFTGYFHLVLEKGLWRATYTLIKLAVFLGMMPFFMAMVFVYSEAVQRAMKTTARYVGTGRGFILQHVSVFNEVPFDRNNNGAVKVTLYNLYKPSGIRFGFWMMFLSIVGVVIWQNVTLIWSVLYMIMVLSAFGVPFLSNPGATPASVGYATWKKLYEEDKSQWTLSLWYREKLFSQ
ncbi:MAG: hypothetical protein KAJ14_02725, partial [Candidatus Omnitrophica bacterium]|nr:hypothetical protein [Candidatus Omnitrophota bacterium]